MREKKCISLIIIMISFALFYSYHVYYYFLTERNNKVADEYIENTIIKKTPVEKTIDAKENESFFGVLEIPKINLKEGFYNKNSSKNNVNQSVTLLKESIMPDESNSIIYLAAHSGNGHLAYFKNINKLTNGDIVKMFFQNSEYNYVITDIYEYPKNGSIVVNKNSTQDYLVLTTCSNNKNMQIVIISKLISKV